MQHLSKKLAILSLAILVNFAFLFASTNHKANSKANTVVNSLSVNNEASSVDEATALYSEIGLGSIGLKQNVFSTAMQGFKKLISKGTVQNDKVLTIADFSQPSTQKRLYVVDLQNKKVLFNTLVAHGKNSGSLWARSFSNNSSSLKSSPGFYVTGNTYFGDNGYSLRLAGLEKNINDNASDRAIVMHGADYVDPSFANAMGFIGRSWGCPAIPMNQRTAIINTVKDGTCLFIYTTEDNYLSRSTVLNSPDV